MNTRLIIWTLTFTAKAYIFGQSTQKSQIYHSITQVYNNPSPSTINFVLNTTTGNGNYKVGEVVYQGFSYASAVATARVVSWSNNVLRLTNINGNFISSQPIYSINNNASYVFNSYNKDGVIPRDIVTITTRPNPANTSNANSLYTYTNTIVENG